LARQPQAHLEAAMMAPGYKPAAREELLLRKMAFHNGVLWNRHVLDMDQGALLASGTAIARNICFMRSARIA